MPVMDVAAAKRDGYSDEEILTELQRRSGVKMDVMAAYRDRYSVDEIAKEVDRRVGASSAEHTQRAQRAAALREQAKNIETRSTGEGFLAGLGAFGRDVSAVGLNAGAGILDAAGGVQGLLSGGDMDNALRRGAKGLQEFTDKNVASPELRKQKQAIDDEAAAAGSDPNDNGFVQVAKQAGARMSGLVTNPLAAADFVGTQAAQLAIPMGAARVAGKGATLAGANAAKIGTIATRASVGAGAAIQGGSVAGGTFDDLVGLPDETWAKLPAYQEKLAGGASPDEAKQDIAEGYALMAGGVGALTSLLFNKGDLAQTTERVLAGAGKESAEKTLRGRGLEALKKTGMEALVSEPGEEVTGQGAQNVVVHQVDENRKLTEGLGDALGGAVLGGGVMGGLSGAGETFLGGGIRSKDGKPAAPPATEGSPSPKVDVSSLESPDPVSKRNLAARAKERDADFAEAVAARPELTAAADAWRKENPHGNLDAFLEQVSSEESAQKAEDAATHPKVQEAGQVHQEAVATLEAAQAVASADPTQAPPGRLTPAQAQDIQRNGTAKLEAAAKAAEENVRTVRQTVEKESDSGSVTEGVGEAVKKARTEAKSAAAQVLKETQGAMLQGATEFDGEKLTKLAEESGMAPEAAAQRVAAVKKRVDDRKKKEREKAAKDKARGGQGESGRQTPAKATSAPAATPQGKELVGKNSIGESVYRDLDDPSVPMAILYGGKWVYQDGKNTPRFQVDASPAPAKATSAPAAPATAAPESKQSPSDETVVDPEAPASAPVEASSTPAQGGGPNGQEEGQGRQGLTEGTAPAAPEREDAGAESAEPSPSPSAQDVRDLIRITREEGKASAQERFGQLISERGMSEQEQTDFIAAFQKAKEASPVSVGKVGDAILSRLREDGSLPKDNRELKALVAEIDGASPNVLRMKRAQEELEAAVAVYARAIAVSGWKHQGDTKGAERASQELVFASLLDLYKAQPNLSIRTSTSMENQAYSTPVPLSYLADLLADITPDALVYEPTAGNGLLLVNVDPAKVTVNELDPARFERLRAQGFERARNGDALTASIDGLVAEGSQDAVITNPPFGPIFEDGQKVAKRVDGFIVKKIDHLIAARALDAMKADGRATLIIAASKEPGGLQEADRIFFNWLYSRYHVVDHFEVDGDLYSRQGAGWPVRVISIHGRVDSENLSPEAGTVPRFTTWEDIHDHVRTVLDSEGFNRIPDPVAVPQGSGRLEGDAGVGSADPVGKPQRARGGDGGRGADAVAPSVPPVRGPVDVDGRPAADPGSVGEDGGGPALPPADRLDPVEGGEAVGGAGGRSGAPDGRDLRRPAGTDVVARRIVETDANEAQAEYLPASRMTPGDQGIMIPTNMAQANADAMTDLRNQVGDLGAFIQNELGYSSMKEVDAAFMGTQMDSIAAAIWNAKNGKAVIIADQTGIGKGRMAAAMIRWAIRNGKVPAFITVDPKLFTSMHEDLVDIGTNDVKPMILNADASIFDRDGKTKLVAGLNGKNRGKILDSGKDGLATFGANAIFSTYSQFNQSNRQQQFLRSMAEDIFVIMDESHNAAGSESNTGIFFQDIIKRAGGVTYLSATWAKRPDNIGVYSKTDLGSLEMSPDELQSAMVRGGFPLQTIISSALARAGQIFRRERSFKGVSFKTVAMSAKRAEHEVLNDQVTTCLRAIMDADRAFHDGFVAGMKPKKGQKVKDNAGNRASRSVAHTEFSSVVHNFIKQLSLALKVNEVADRAIKIIQEGGAPVIGLESTMGSFLTEYARQNGIAHGDSLGNFGWKHILSRALDRTRYITIKDEKGNETQQYVSIEELDGDTRAFYRQAMDAIQELRIDLPASPIDWIRYRLQDAGVKVGEITGRENYVDYSDPKNPLLIARQDKKADQVKLVNDFRSGHVQAMILNVSGSTGISLHNDARWTDPKNPRPRTMLIAQPMGDINVFMQLLGRIFRTGQISPPSYEILTLDLPSEIRPTANLSRKMKGLNANTSSDTEGNTKIEAVDVLNQYGSQIVNEYLLENPELARRLHVRTNEASEDETATVDADFATKVTGRLAVLPVEEQRKFWSEIIPRYNEHIDYLNSVGENKLVRRTLDLRAKVVSQEMIYAGATDGGSFAGPAYLAQCEVRADGKPMSADEARAAIKENEGTQNLPLLRMKAKAAFNEYITTLKEDGAALAERFRGRFEQDPPPKLGQTVVVKAADGEVSGVVINLEANIERGNPYAASKWKVTIATNSKSFRVLRIPLSKFRAAGFSVDMDLDVALTATRESTIRRFLVFGNILGGYRALGEGVDGEIISTTLESGETADAIRLPSSFRPDTGLREDMDLAPEESARVLARIAGTSRPYIASKDRLVRASVTVNGDVLLELQEKKRETVMKVSKALGLEFANGVATVPMSEAKELLARIPFQAMRPALEEVGLLHKGEIRPEAFERPTAFDSIRPEHIRAAAKILGVEHYAHHFEAKLASWNRSMQEVADLTGKMESLASGIEDGSVSIAEARKLLSSLNDKGAAPGSKLRTSDLEQVCTFLARATLAQKASIPEVQAKEVPSSILYDGDFRKLLSKLYPFVADPSGKEMLNAIKYATWCYEQKHGDGLNLNTPSGRREFYSYLSGEMKLQSSASASLGAVAIGLLSAGFVVAPGLAASVGAAVAAWHMMKAGRWVWDKFKGQHSPRTRIMGANSKSNVVGGEVVEMLDQVFLRSSEIAAPAQAVLRQMQAAAESLGRPMDEIGKAIADHLEGAELPTELQELGVLADRVRSHFARRIAHTGGNIIDNHFHRVYDFEGLQRLKGDPAAMKAVAEQVRGQILENDPARVAKAAEATGMPVEQAAYLMALETLQSIYDGSDEAKAKKEAQRAKERDDYILSLLDKGDGKAPSYAAFAKIREFMKSGVRQFSAAGTKARKVSFQLPESVQLSDGSEVRLVDRNFFTVYPKYVTDMSRSLAQKELLNTRKVNQFLNGIGPAGETERDEIETFIQNDLWQRTERSFEGNTRKFAVALKNANSVRFLALNIWYPLRNIMFGSAMTMALTGPVPWVKAGWKLGRTMVPGLRRADVDKASLAGAIMQEIVDDHLHTAGRAGRWLTFPMLYSQQAVDVAGFYAGRYYAPTVLDKAMRENKKGERGEFSDLLREALGATRAEQVIEAGAFQEDDLDRFGLVYRNMISGTGRNLNLPKFLGTEAGRFLFQFSSIPAEQTRIFATRIMGTNREVKYWSGALFAGAVLLAAQWAAAGMGGTDDDKEEKAIDWYSDWSSGSAVGRKLLYMMSQSGSFQRFAPAWGAFVANPSGWKPTANDLALSMTGVGPMVSSTAGLLVGVGKGVDAFGKAGEEGYSLAERVEVGAMPVVRNLANNQQSLLRGIGVKVGRTEVEESLSGR